MTSDSVVDTGEHQQKKDAATEPKYCIIIQTQKKKTPIITKNAKYWP